MTYTFFGHYWPKTICTVIYIWFIFDTILHNTIFSSIKSENLQICLALIFLLFFFLSIIIIKFQHLDPLVSLKLYCLSKSLDQFNLGGYKIKLVKTAWTYSKNFFARSGKLIIILHSCYSQKRYISYFSRFLKNKLKFPVGAN